MKNKLFASDVMAAKSIKKDFLAEDAMVLDRSTTSSSRI